MKRLFSVSCPGCGMARAFVAIMRFDFVAALKYNVLSLLLFIGIAVYYVTFFIDIIFDKNNIEKAEAFMGKPYMLVVYFVLLMFLTVYNNVV